MEPQLYLEMDTPLQTEACKEWIGREYARSVNSEWPVPPDSYSGPQPPPPSTYTRWWLVPAMKPNDQGGVFTLDDDTMNFATQPQTLSDGNEYDLDLPTVAKTFEQLSPAAQLLLNPPLE